MLDGLIRWSLRNRLAVLAGAGVFLVWGGVVLRQVPVDVLPDVTAPTVTVLVEGRGMAPTDMEALVTLPLEAVMNGASGVRRVRSATAVGLAVVWVDFDWGEDIYRARQTVSEKLSSVLAQLPDAVAPPVLAPLSSIMGEIMFVALESAAHSPIDLRTTADVVVRRRLLATRGVAQVTVIGGERRQFEVLVESDRLSDYGLSLTAVEEALRRANRNTSAGFRQAGGQEYLIQGVGRLTDVEAIAETVIGARGTRPIRVADVAAVEIGAGLRRGDGSRNGRPAVILGIHRQPDVNTVALTRDPRPGARRHPGRSAGRHAARHAAVPAGRLHRARDGQPDARAAGRDAARGRGDPSLSRQPARRSHHPARDSPVAPRRRSGAPRPGAVHQQHDPRGHGHRGRGPRPTTPSSTSRTSAGACARTRAAPPRGSGRRCASCTRRAARSARPSSSPP